jgi:hypothetical protein
MYVKFEIVSRELFLIDFSASLEMTIGHDHLYRGVARAATHCPSFRPKRCAPDSLPLVISTGAMRTRQPATGHFDRSDAQHRGAEKSTPKRPCEATPYSLVKK